VEANALKVRIPNLAGASADEGGARGRPEDDGGTAYAVTGDAD
jgi:hypothetical protein